MSLIDKPFLIAYHSPRSLPASLPPPEIFLGDLLLGSVRTAVRLINPLESIYSVKVLLNPAIVERWIEESCRSRGLFIDPELLLFESEHPQTAGRTNRVSSRDLLIHVLNWKPATARIEISDEEYRYQRAVLLKEHHFREALTDEGAPDEPHKTPWSKKTWEYRSKKGPPRRKNKRLKLQAPEFDWSWSDEYRAVLLSAPPFRCSNTVPLLKTFLIKPSYARYWNAEILEIFRQTPKKAPKTLAGLDCWYPPDKRRPNPTDDHTAWTSQRLLDGFACLPIQKHHTSGRIAMDISWHDVGVGGEYELPWTTAWWTQEESGWVLDQIDIGRRRWRHRKRGLKDTTPQTIQKAYDIRTITRQSTDREWQHAQYVMRSNMLLAGEVDTHLARSHLLIESITLMLEKSARTKTTLTPITTLLQPFIRDASGINNLGDALILGGNGVIAQCSGLGKKALRTRLTNQLACTDWRGFAPRGQTDHPILKQDHRYGVACQAFWKGIGTFVDAELATSITEEVIEALADALSAHAEHSPRAQTLQPRNDCEFVYPDESVRKHSPASGHLSIPASADEVRAFCRWVIFHAICVHGWVNDEAWLDGGSLAHAVFGIVDLDPPRRGESLESWLEETGPRRSDAAMQLAVGWVLEKVQWGLFGFPKELDTMETIDKQSFKELPVVVSLENHMRDGGLSSPAAALNQIGCALESWRIRINS